MQKRKNDLNFDKFIKFPMPEKIFNGPKIKVREDGQVFISPSVIESIRNNDEEMWADFRHTEDYKTVAIKLDGDKSFKFPKGGSMKFKKWKEILQKFGYSIPAVYWLEWNPEEKSLAWPASGSIRIPGYRENGMIKRQKEMSDYEYAQLDKMVYQLYLVYGKGLEFDECRSIAFLKYVEVRKELHDFYNEDLLWLYSKNRIIDAFKEAQREKNRQIRLEAKLSMNQLIGESGEPVYTILFPARGNFVNYVCLWHDMRQLGKMCYTILLALYWGSEDWEIVDCLKISAQAYFNIKDFLRMKLKAYVEI